MNRTDFLHIKSAFNPSLLAELRERLRFEFLKQKINSDRDKAAQHHGVGTDTLRFDPAWYSPWESFDDVLLLDGQTMVNFPPQVRWVRGWHQLSPWHQDKAYIEKLGQVLTCFVPLDDEPWKHSTLEFTEAYGEVEHVLDEVYKGPKMAVAGSQGTYFQLELGDCLLFGDLAPHRTVVPKNASLERFSLEYRLSKPDELVPGKDYFNILTGEMTIAQAS